MKSLEIYIAHELSNGDDETREFFDLGSALAHLSDVAAHLTSDELADADLYAEGYTVRLPDEYTITSAKQLMIDLANGDVESPDFDDLTGSICSAQIFYKTYENEVEHQ